MLDRLREPGYEFGRMPNLIGTGTALAIGGGLGAIGSVAGGAIQGGAAKDAASAQAAATREQIAAQERAQAQAIAFAREQSAQAREDLQPFREAQLGALDQLQQFTQGGSEFETAQRGQATEAIQRQLAAQGLLRSGSQVRSLEGLETNLLGQRLNVLQALSGSGAGQQQAAISQNLGGQLSGIAQQGGAQIGSSLGQLGAIQGQLAINQGNALSGAFSGVNQAIQGTTAGFVNLNQQAQQNALLQSLLGRRGAAVSSAGAFTGNGLNQYYSGVS